MPRQPDPAVEERILHAAQKLWKKGGEKALTMRAVARAAGTNTPAVYRRFCNRRAILHTLLRRIQQDVSDALRSSRSPEEVCERYLDYALTHPHEYELFYQHVYQLPHGGRSRTAASLREQRPTFAIMGEKLAERFGKSDADHARLSLALWTVAHGTAMILISKAIPAEHAPELRTAFAIAVSTLLAQASGFLAQPAPKS
jgi:AcrR family transcriptional regulator